MDRVRKHPNPQAKTKNLVFQGGSVKGIAYIGAVAALSKIIVNDVNEGTGASVLSKIKNVAGTSAGAIMALLVALDLTVDEIMANFANVDFISLLDDEGNWLKKNDLVQFGKQQSTSGFLTVLRKGGKDALRNGVGFSTNLIRKWLEETVKKALGDDYTENLTFSRLHALAGKSSKRNLFVVAYNLTKNEKIVFSYKNTPNVLVIDAVLVSMSLPYVFNAPTVKSQSSDEDFLTESDDVYTDGGIVDNYPTDVFKDQEAETIGFYFADQDLKNHILSGLPIPEQDAKGVKKYTAALLNTLLVHLQLQNHLSCPVFTIYIDPCQIGMLDFDISKEAKNQLIRSGWDASLEAFQFPLSGIYCPELPITTTQGGALPSRKCHIL